MEYTKVNQNISNTVNEQVRKLEQLFPAAVKDGEVDFQALREELGQFEETDSEKYELTWAGKKNAKKIAQEDIVGKTLKFIPEESKNADTTENLYIEGDNLEVLKLLRQNYYGAVKMIYIDPPYNTGNDFVYNDSFTMNRTEADIKEGITDELGLRFVVNKEFQNRYHANWLNMMYPRLRVAHDLLTDDGVIFISIDDNEVTNLVEICDEVFGRENRIALICHKSRASISNDKIISPNHNIILFYAKRIEVIELRRKMIGLDPILEGFELNDNDGKGEYRLVPVDGPGGAKKGNPHYTFLGVEGYWRFSEATMQEKYEQGLVIKKGNSLYQKYYKTAAGASRKTTTTWWDDAGLISSATSKLKNLMGEATFDTPKPLELIDRMLRMITHAEKNAIILDFFAGSSTTAHAVMNYNLEDQGHRRYIMVQLPEQTADYSEARKNGYQTICEIGKERIRRAGEKIKRENPDANIDIGFKVFRVADTNIKWNARMDAGQLDLSQIENTPDLVDFMPDANDIDIVYELMLRQRNVALSENLEQLSDIGKRTYLYASSYLVCLETDITVELVNKLAELDPLPIKFIFRDSAFKDDIALKDETFRRLKALINKNTNGRRNEYTIEFI
ncbi:MAG: site-specific DNA-methyltransferase [Lachnoclostridium sp.]|nr:site-specific DNA-methyltransferase [Lachnospira sp.]MCM1247149.1 site-specific DNA-methyltransferase [Lachnoclostridium sp.]